MQRESERPRWQRGKVSSKSSISTNSAILNWADGSDTKEETPDAQSRCLCVYGALVSLIIRLFCANYSLTEYTKLANCFMGSMVKLHFIWLSFHFNVVFSFLLPFFSFSIVFHYSLRIASFLPEHQLQWHQQHFLHTIPCIRFSFDVVTWRKYFPSRWRKMPAYLPIKFKQKESEKKFRFDLLIKLIGCQNDGQ